MSALTIDFNLDVTYCELATGDCSRAGSVRLIMGRCPERPIYDIMMLMFILYFSELFICSCFCDVAFAFGVGNHCCVSSHDVCFICSLSFTCIAIKILPGAFGLELCSANRCQATQKSLKLDGLPGSLVSAR